MLKQWLVAYTYIYAQTLRLAVVVSSWLALQSFAIYCVHIAGFKV